MYTMLYNVDASAFCRGLGRDLHQGAGNLLVDKAIGSMSSQEGRPYYYNHTTEEPAAARLEVRSRISCICI